MQATGNNSLYRYRMSIRVLADGFSLYIYNVGDGSILQQENYVIPSGHDMADAMAKVLDRPRMMEYRFAQVELSTDTPTTYIPLEEFRREEIGALYRTVFSEEKVSDEDVQYEILKKLEVVELYQLDKKVKEVLEERFDQVGFHAFQGQIFEKGRGCDMLCYVEDAKILVGVYSKGHLVHACEYPATCDADRLYYILYLWKVLGMNSQKQSCSLCKSSASLQKDLKQFLPHVQTLELD